MNQTSTTSLKSSSCLPFVFAAEAGLFKDGDGDQHSPHRPVAHHRCHAEWLWGIQPEVWLRGRPRLFPRLNAPRLPAEGQGQRVHINTHTLRSDNLYLLSPRSKKKKPVFSYVAEKIHSSPEKKSAPWPCHESADQGKLLLALVGPESHDFNLHVVMGVTSGKGHLMPWRTVAHFQQQREDPLTPSPILPCPSPSHHASLSGCSRCCSEYNHRGAFVQNHKTLKGATKSAFW